VVISVRLCVCFSVRTDLYHDHLLLLLPALVFLERKTPFCGLFVYIFCFGFFFVFCFFLLPSLVLFQPNGKKTFKLHIRCLFYCTLFICAWRFQIQSMSLKQTRFFSTSANFSVLFISIFWRFVHISFTWFIEHFIPKNMIKNIFCLCWLQFLIYGEIIIIILSVKTCKIENQTRIINMSISNVYTFIMEKYVN